MADLWYYTSNGRQMEPVSTAELRRKAGDGTLRPTDMVWREGMPRWVRAASVTEVFAGLPPAHDSAPNRRDERDRRSRRRADAEDDRPSRRRPPEPSGAPVGLIVTLLVAGGIVIAMVVGGVVIGLVINSGPPPIVSTVVSPGPTADAAVTYTVDLEAGQDDVRPFALKAKMRYEILLRSDRNTDVDLFVFDGSREMAKDDAWDKDGRILWEAPATKAYRFVVRNLGPGSNRSHITIREAPLAHPLGDPFPAEPLPADVKTGHGVVPFDNILPGAHEEFKLHLAAERAASVRVIVHQPAGTDVRLELCDANNQVVASAEQPGRASVQVRHTPAATGVYRVRVRNAGDQAVRVTVTY
jgi:hypothetical protein